MLVELTWPASAVIITIAAHGGFSVWWASKITAQIDNLAKCLDKMDFELGKRDTQISAAWKRIDQLGNRVTAVESRCHIEHKEEA